MPDECILVTGAAGQLGAALTAALRESGSAVLAVDLQDGKPDAGPSQRLDVLSREELRRLIDRESVTTVYHLAAMKSSEAETRREAAWNVNVNGLYNVLDALRGRPGAKLIFPSSIAAFGPDGGDPLSLYGVTKRTGEMLCGFFHKRFGLDARALRLPGVLSPDFDLGGGGLTDFAAEIFWEAAARKRYESYLEADTEMELIHLSDAVAALRALAQAPPDAITRDDAYLIRSFAAGPERLGALIREKIPAFELAFKIDAARQGVARSLPTHYDDSAARADWGFNPRHTLESVADEFLDRALDA